MKQHAHIEQHFPQQVKTTELHVIQNYVIQTCHTTQPISLRDHSLPSIFSLHTFALSIFLLLVCQLVHYNVSSLCLGTICLSSTQCLSFVRYIPMRFSWRVCLWANLSAWMWPNETSWPNMSQYTSRTRSSFMCFYNGDTHVICTSEANTPTDTQKRNWNEINWQ